MRRLIVVSAIWNRVSPCPIRCNRETLYPARNSEDPR
jgi:hypothetical protein